MPSKESSFGQASRSIPPANRPAQPPQNPSGASTRFVGNYHQPPSHHLNHNPYYPPAHPSRPSLPSSSPQVPSNLTNSYSHPSSRHPSYGDHYQLVPPPHHHHSHPNPTPSSSSILPPHPSSTQQPQHHVPLGEPRKIAGHKRKPSTSPSPERHPDNHSIRQPTNATSRHTPSSAWGRPPSPPPTSNHHLNHPQAYTRSSYHPTHQQPPRPSSPEACETVPSSLAGLLSTHPACHHSSSETRNSDAPHPTPPESLMSRSDPNRSRGRPTITKLPASQTHSQIQHTSASQPPPSADRQWCSHHRSSVGCSPQISRNTIVSTADPAESSSRANYSKPSTPLTTNQTLPEQHTSDAYGHSFRSDNPYPPGSSSDIQHSRSPTVYYHSHPNHRQSAHPHPQHPHPASYPSPVSHDHRPELHLRTNFSHQAARQSSLSTPDAHHLPTRPDPDPKHSYQLHHQSPSYENQFLHPSQNRLHHSDASRPSPGMSPHSLPHPVSRPSTSSSLTNQQSSLGVASQQQVRRPHHVDSPSGSPDRPRLYQPEPRRVTMSSPDLQLQSSPRHQNTDIYPSQATSERPSQQQAMPNSVHHFRPSHTQPHPPAHPSEGAQFSPPRPLELYSEQLHSSTAGPSRHRASRSTDMSTNPLPSRQSHPQPMYMHELSPRFQQHHGPSPQVESSSRRSENSLRERSHQPLSHESEQQQSPRTGFSTTHLASDQAHFAHSLPENITVQHTTYHRRDHLASPIVMQLHPSYSGSSQRQQLQTHYEHQHPQSSSQQYPINQIKSPSNLIHHSSLARAEQSPGSRPSAPSYYGVPSNQQASRPQPRSNGFSLSHEHPIDPSPETPQQKKSSALSNYPPRSSRPSKMEKMDGLPRTGSSQPWSRITTHTSEMDPRYNETSHTSVSNKPGGNREKPAKISPQLERPTSKGSTSLDPTSHPRLASHPVPSTDPKKTKFLSHHRPSSPPSRYSLVDHGKEKEINDEVRFGRSRPKLAHDITNSNADGDTSREPSSTEDGADDDAVDDGVIRCICSITTDDGFTIQCETCEVWQHAVCVNVPIDEVPEHYFCDRCDPSPEQRRRLTEMAPQAERIQRQRLKKEADTQDQAGDENSITQGSPSPSHQPAVDDQDESPVDSPVASTAMSRVSSGVGVNECIQAEPSAQSPSSHGKGKVKASSLGYQERVQTISYPENGLGLSGLQESPALMSGTRADDVSLPRDPVPRKPGRKPTKFAQAKPQSSKQSLDPPPSCSAASNTLEFDSTAFVHNGADTDDKYEAWRYEYTPTLKDIYLDAEVKCQVQQLITNFTRLQNSCEDTAPVDADMEAPGPVADAAEKPVLPAPPKPLPTPTENCRSPVQGVDQLSQVGETPPKSQRTVPHAYASTDFVPVTMLELPPPIKLTIKPITPSTINLFPSLASNPFCPTFANSLNNSSTSSLPRLITHGVFSTQAIPRGSYIASIRGSITSVRKYAKDVYNQYATLGCNKPYVKLFKSTKLQDRLLRDQDLAQIDDGLVIDSRQYGNEMRFVRNGCHPNAFINIIMTPPAPRLPDSEPTDRHVFPQSGTPLSRASSFPTPGIDRPHHPNHLWSTYDRDRHSPWEVSFAIFAASDISRREEIILPWEWDDQHLVHLMPRLLSHSTAFEAQQQRTPSWPATRIQFLPWSMSDLRLLSCKLAAVTLTFLGLMICGCERKKSCAVHLMWKIGCLSAGQPMFPANPDVSPDSEASEFTSISSLKERQEMHLPSTFEEKLRLALHSFAEQPIPQPLKVGRNANSAANASAPNVSRPKRPKIDLGPMLGLRRDWWLYPTAGHPQADLSRLDSKTLAKKQKRPRSRSVFNRKPSVHKIRRVSDVGELRQPGLTVANSINQPKDSSLPEAGPSQPSNIYPLTPAQETRPETHIDNHSTAHSQSVQRNQHSLSLPSPLPPSQHALQTDDASVRHPSTVPSTAQDKPINLSAARTHQQESLGETSDNRSTVDTRRMDVESGVLSGVDTASKSEMSMAGRDEAATERIEGVSEVHQAKKNDHDQVQLAGHQLQLENGVGVVRENGPFRKGTSDQGLDPSQLHAVDDVPAPIPSARPLEEVNSASSAPEEGELREEESYSEEAAVQHPLHASPSAPILASPIQQDSTKPEIKTPGHESISMEPSDNGQRMEGGDVPMDQSPAQFSSQAGNIDVDSQRRGGIVGSDPPAIAIDRLPDAYPKDLTGSGAQHTETDSLPEISLDRRHDVSVPHQTPISSRAQDSRQLVLSVAADVTPEPMVTSPKSINAHDSIPAVASSHQHNDNELQSVVDVSGKSTDPVHNALGLDTREITRKTEVVDGNHQASIIEDHHQVAVPTSTQAENADNVTDQSSQPRHLILSEETRQSPKSATSPSLNSTTEQMDLASPTRLSHRSVSTHSELPSEAQDESALSQPSDGSEESLLDSDASTTILASSDEEMLSSHTPRYLNNRKRIRSKNIIKPPPRIAAIKKTTAPPHLERPNGLAAGAMTRSEFRAIDKLKPPPVGYQKGDSNKTSSLSDLESEDERHADPVGKQSGSQMRRIIRSSSPAESDDNEADERVTGKQPRRSKVSPTPSLSSAPDLSSSHAMEVVDVPVGNENLKRLEPVSGRVPPALPSLGSSSHDQSTGPVELPKSDQTMGSLDATRLNDPRTVVTHVAVPATLPASKQLQAALVTPNLPLAAVEKQEAGRIEPTAEAKSTFTENSGATQLSDALPSTNIPVSEANELGAPHENTSLASPAAISETQLKKAAPKRISLKDYRSRKVSETVVITPLANPLIHFTATRPTPATITEEPQRKHAPPPIIPVLPPLLPPTSQSQPLLPLSPRKLELVASVLKKEEKDNARSSQDGATDPNKPAHESQIPNTPLPDASSLPPDAVPNQIPQDRNAQTGEVDLKKSINTTVLGFLGRLSDANTAQHNSDQHQQAKLSPQTCDDPAATGAYEDDIDGVAIESMSTPSEGEPDDEERPQEVVDNVLQQPHLEMVDDEEKKEARTPKQLQTLDEAQAEPFCKNLPQQSDATHDKQQPTIQDQHEMELDTGDGGQQGTTGVEKQQGERAAVEQPQEGGIDGSMMANASDGTEPPSVHEEADLVPMQDLNLTPSASNERADQMMEVDQPESCPPTKSVGPESSLPPGHPTRNSNEVPAQLLVSKPERAESSSSPRNATQSVAHEDLAPEDVSLSPSVVQQKLPAPKPRLSLADYRRRNVRPSVSEERHPAQSMSPSLPDLELSRANAAGFNSLQQHETNNHFQLTQPNPKHEASTPGDAADEARHALPAPSRSNPSPSQQQEQQLGHKTNMVGVEAAGITLALNVSSGSRPADTSMYFPPISPSILMGMESSSRSPDLKSSLSPPGSPSEETTVHQETNDTVLPKSSSRTPLESTPVTSTSSLKTELKPSVAILSSTAVPPFAGHLAQPSGAEDRVSQQAASPASDSLGVPPPCLQPVPPKSKSAQPSGPPNGLPPPPTLFDQHKTSSPSNLVSSLPTTGTSHSQAPHHRKPTSIVVSGGTQSTTIGSNAAPSSRMQTPLDGKFSLAHGDQSIPSAPSSSRHIPGPSPGQQSPTIPLSPLVYKPSASASPSSLAPTGMSELRASPPGPSNLSPGLSRGAPSRTGRAPPSHNTSRASWPLEPAGLPNPPDSQYSSQVSFSSDLPPNPSLPPPPTHPPGPSRNSPYHYSSPHRGVGFPPMRNFSGHRMATSLIMGTSGPGPPPPSFRPSQNSDNEGMERLRHDGALRGPGASHSSSYLARGRAKVRGVGPSSSSTYWPLDNNPGSGGHGSSNSSSGGGGGGGGANSGGGGGGTGRGFGGPPRNDR